MNQVCRCCLTENPSFTYNIFHENLQHELLLCVPSVNIEPDDGLPELICEQCWLHLREAIEFRRRCEENDRELRKRYDETNQAIEKALGLCILSDMNSSGGGGGAQDERLYTTEGMNFDVMSVQRSEHETAIEEAVQLLEEYTNEMEMTMLDDLMLEDHSLSCLTDVQKTDNGENEDNTIINELLSKFLNETVLESTTETLPPATTDTQNFIKVSQQLPSSAACQTTTDISMSNCFTGFEADTTTQPESSKRTANKSMHPCQHCEKKFTRNFQLKLHLISVHGIGDGLQYTCLECKKCFASRHSLNYHQKALHSLERPHICQYCQRSFVLRSQLDSHMRTHTGEIKPRTHLCMECGKNFITKSDLKTHTRSHDPKVVRPFKCKHCEKSFFTQGHLSSHELVHSGEKPYKCPLCEKAYQNIGNLNNHIYRNHLVDGKQNSLNLEGGNLEKNFTYFENVQSNV